MKKHSEMMQLAESLFDHRINLKKPLVVLLRMIFVTKHFLIWMLRLYWKLKMFFVVPIKDSINIRNHSPLLKIAYSRC